MKFTEILENLKKGEKVTREKWEKPSCTIDFIMYDQKKEKCGFYLAGKYCDDFVFDYEDITTEDWKIYEEPNQVWQPKRNEKYYFVTSCGNIGYDDFDCYIDENRVNFKNAFETEEEAAHMAEKLKIITKLRELSNIKFNENQKAKWSVIYDFSYNKVGCVYNKYTKHIPFEACFKTKEDCENAIKEIGEENLKKYYFDVEDNQ